MAKISFIPKNPKIFDNKTNNQPRGAKKTIIKIVFEGPFQNFLKLSLKISIEFTKKKLYNQKL